METNNEKAERLVFTVEETAKILGISRGTAYLLANSGGIPAIRLGHRRLVGPCNAWADFLASGGKTKEN